MRIAGEIRNKKIQLKTDVRDILGIWHKYYEKKFKEKEMGMRRKAVIEGSRINQVIQGGRTNEARESIIEGLLLVMK